MATTKDEAIQALVDSMDELLMFLSKYPHPLGVDISGYLEDSNISLDTMKTFGFTPRAINPNSPEKQDLPEPRLPFDCFTPVVSSEEYGEDEHETQDSIQEALATLERIQAKAAELNDDVEREYSIRCV